MIKPVSTLFVVCFMLSGIYAQDKKDTTLVIEFDKTVYDYGTIEQGSDGICKFSFTNKGTTPLILTNVRSSCGCSVPTWPQSPIEPGNSGTIEVKYNTAIMGSFSKSITVTSNAVNSRVVLNIKGNVVAKKL